MNIEQNCFFEPFTDQVRGRLISVAEHRNFGANIQIFEEDSFADGVYLLLSGQVELFKFAREHRVEVLARVEAGDYFGEVGVIDRSGRSTFAKAITETAMAWIPAAALMGILETEKGEVTIHFLRRVSHHLRTTNERFIQEVIRKEKMQWVGEMASAIIHDIKSPMMGVQLAVDMIRSEANTDHVDHLCMLISKQTNIISTMAQELLDYAKGRCELVKHRINVRDLFRDLELLNADYLRKSGVDLRIDSDDFIVDLDKGRIMRVLQNLLTNAIDAFGGKGGRIEIHALCRQDKQVRLSLKDNGPGIPESIRETIFEPFVTEGKGHGTGLGMAIAQSIVQAHGGTISFETATGEGTTFIIDLPPESFPQIY